VAAPESEKRATAAYMLKDVFGEDGLTTAAAKVPPLLGVLPSSPTPTATPNTDPPTPMHRGATTATGVEESVLPAQIHSPQAYTAKQLAVLQDSDPMDLDIQ
jgi:hypothetical protein